MASPQDVKHLKRHTEYYIRDGNIHVLVEETHFCVHSYFLVRESPIFRGYFKTPVGPGQVQKGTSDSNAVVLENVTAQEFAIFLWVFYDPNFSRETTSENWKIILDLAHKWSFPEVKALAINALESIPIPLVERIGLYQKYDISEEIIYPHYAALCARTQPITLAETEILGIPTTLMIFSIRERLLSQSSGRTVDRFDAKVFLRSVNSYFESQKKHASTPKDEKPVNGADKSETGAT